MFLFFNQDTSAHGPSRQKVSLKLDIKAPASKVWDIVSVNSILSSSEGSHLPINFNLSQNYPNPFNPTTIIKYSLPIDTQVKITIHNLLGKKIKTLVNDEQTSGIRAVVWNGTNYNNQKVSSGLYLYSIQTTKYVNTKKMILLK